MNKKYILTALSVLLISVGCERKEEVDLHPGSDFTYFNGSLESCSTLTKTTITDGSQTCTVAWVKGDTILINGKRYTADSSCVETRFTAFDSPAAEGPSFQAYYPSSLVSGDKTILPSVQKFGGDGVISNVPAYAFSTSNTLSFHSLCGVLAVKVDNSDITTLKCIKVSADQPLCGEFEPAETGTSGIWYAKLKSEAKDTVVTLDFETPLSVTESHIFYITVPVGDYTNIRVSLSSDGSNYYQMMSTVADKQVAIARNTVYAFNYRLNTIFFNSNVVLTRQL